jgi:hypothetical protein
MKYGCRNDEDEVECTDFRRGVLKYITKDGDIKQITSKYLKSFMSASLNSLRQNNVKLSETIYVRRKTKF